MDDKLTEGNQPLPTEQGAIVSRPRRYGVPPFDPDKYRSEIDDFDLTDEQATELLQTLWNIMYTFVEIGFGGDPVQHIFGKLAEKPLESDAKRDMLKEFNSKSEERDFKR